MHAMPFHGDQAYDTEAKLHCTGKIPIITGQVRMITIIRLRAETARISQYV
jgi:hypothetical protein